MPKRSYQDKLILEELEGHIEDAVEDLVHQGMDEKSARKKAHSQFGNFESIHEEVSAIHSHPSWILLHPATLCVVAYGFVSLVLFMWYVITDVNGTAIELFTLWWIFFGIGSVVLMVNRWITEYLGLQSIQVIWTTFLFTFFASLSLTVVLDIDNFEGSIHALLLAAVLIISSKLLWNKLTVRWKYILIYGFTVATIWSSAAEQPLFDFIGTARCLFITPDDIPLTGALAYCKQIKPFSGYLIPIYLVMLIGAPYLFRFLWRYLQSTATARYRKMILTAAFAAIPLFPFFLNDLNNYGQLDVVKWKPDIYEVYWETLGRRPEEKDILFYAQTRAYENLDAVREVLYNSKERKIKIDLIYQEVLGRNARKRQTQQYVEHRTSVDEIYNELRLQVQNESD